MEGLLIAEQLRSLAPLIPSERRAWRFPDDRTAVLPLAGEVSLWLSTRPPQPRFEVRTGAPGAAPPNTPFQEQLAARVVGHLVAASQPALDRVVRFDFAPGEGFVPEPGTSLVVELTGRNANLVLLDDRGTILGVERVILAQRNRYRELRPGIAYVPPPPYEKLNPLEVSHDQLLEALRGRSLKDVRDVVDGIGAELFGALRAMLVAPSAPDSSEVAGTSSIDTRLEGNHLTAVVEAVKRLAAEPSVALATTGNRSDVAELRREHRLSDLRSEVLASLNRQLKLANRRVIDAEQAEAAAEDAGRLREQADLLLANAGHFAAVGTTARVRGYDGEEVVLDIDPRMDAAENAKARYDRARRREARAARAAAQLPALRSELASLEQELEALEDADELRLRRLAGELAGGIDGNGVSQAAGVRGGGSGARAGARAAGVGKNRKKGNPGERHGVHFLDPRGYEVFVGRSAKENDAITFKVARSRDLWLHVQGYRGAHVVVRSQGRELPFDTVLFAARLAAGFSQARDSDNVPVDYTERKHVWRQKGGPAGAVNFAHHKTVYVTPARDDAAASGAAAG